MSLSSYWAGFFEVRLSEHIAETQKVGKHCDLGPQGIVVFVCPINHLYSKARMSVVAHVLTFRIMVLHFDGDG